jgi:hypothetical protein
MLICIAGTDLCIGAPACQALGQCYNVPDCFQGSCLVSTAKANGTSCDDGNAATDFDACQGGICIGNNRHVYLLAGCSSCWLSRCLLVFTGIDLCLTTSCQSAPVCYSSLPCSHGQCFYAPLADNTSCSASTLFGSFYSFIPTPFIFFLPH